MGAVLSREDSGRIPGLRVKTPAPHPPPLPHPHLPPPLMSPDIAQYPLEADSWVEKRSSGVPQWASSQAPGHWLWNWGSSPPLPRPPSPGLCESAGLPLPHLVYRHFRPARGPGPSADSVQAACDQPALLALRALLRSSPERVLSRGRWGPGCERPRCFSVTGSQCSQGTRRLRGHVHRAASGSREELGRLSPAVRRGRPRWQGLCCGPQSLGSTRRGRAQPLFSFHVCARAYSIAQSCLTLGDL